MNSYFVYQKYLPIYPKQDIFLRSFNGWVYSLIDCQLDRKIDKNINSQMDRHNKDIYKNMNRLKEDRQMVRCFIIKINMWIDGQI